MLKYFYLVIFEYTTRENQISLFDLGIFSTKKKANKKIIDSRQLPGFSDFSSDGFKIIKFGVHFSQNIDKSGADLYSVYLEYNDTVDENWIIFDYFSTKEKAMEHIEYLKEHTRIGKKHSNGFNITKIKVDNYNSWSEGFSVY